MTSAAPAPPREPAIIEPGRNCWRVERATRVSFLIDAADYFEAFADATEQAKHSVLVVGWDIHTGTILQPDENGEGPDLATWLDGVLERQPSLSVYLLEWDFSLVYALERDWAPVFRRGGWIKSDRLHFRFDRELPWIASQHQKIVVVDDCVAFTGGIDLAVNRWDTPDHCADNPRRRLPNGDEYGPFHDVQIAVEGPAAAALGELARERWHRATNDELVKTTDVNQHAWPKSLVPDMENVDVAISRTQPTRDGNSMIREVEALYLDAIAAAREYIYIENQYFTAPSVSGALAERLLEPNGPEVVLVLPRHCPGWLEQGTMGVLRQKELARLTQADKHGRLRVVAPVVLTEGAERPITVHAKVLITDDRLVRIGSSNISRRSMGFDSECDLTIEAPTNDERATNAIRTLRNRLLGEHLGLPPDELESRLSAEGSLVTLIDSNPSEDRRLIPIELESDQPENVPLDIALVDPSCPEAPGKVAESFVSDELPSAGLHPWIKAALGLGVLLGLTAAWKWTPLAEWVKPETLANLAAQLREHPMTPAIVLALYVGLSLLMVPITALFMATALAFGLWEAVLYSSLGSTLGGAAGFIAGRQLGHDTVQRLAGPRMKRLKELSTRRGLLSVIAIRLLPVAPFTIVNLAMGASGIRLRDFVIGTFVSLLPGILAINVFKTNLAAAISNPSWSTISWAALVLTLAVVLLALTRRLLRNLGRRNA